MSERGEKYTDNEFEALFGEIADSLGADEVFADRMAAASDDLEVLAATDVMAKLHIDGQARPYGSESITDVGEQLHAAFIQLCQEYCVDINTVLPSTDDYGDINEILALLVYQMKGRIWLHDTISATNALVLDLRNEDDDAMGVTSIEADEKIVGSFTSPVVGPLPDEAHVLAADGTAPLPMGVGLRLVNPVLIDKNGEVHDSFFKGDVIIALGTIGLQLERLHFLEQE